MHQTPEEPETFICLDWRKTILATKGPILNLDQISVFMWFKISQRTFEDQGLIAEVKKISALIGDWENDNAHGKYSSKARTWMLASAIRFIL